MNNDIVQLTDKNGNNVFPIAGAATQDSISKSMLEEGVFEGPELFPAPTGAYVRTNDIVDDAVTTSKIADESVTSDKIDWTTIETPKTSGVYSTTEKAVGVWIDGKTIYRKVWSNINVWGSAGQNVATQTGVDKLIRIYGIMRRNGSATSVPFYFSGSNFAVLNYATNGTIYLDATGSDTNNKIDVILEYTKA